MRLRARPPVGELPARDAGERGRRPRGEERDRGGAIVEDAEHGGRGRGHDHEDRAAEGDLAGQRSGDAASVQATEVLRDGVDLLAVAREERLDM